ncbi:protein kinase, partial [Trypanosoma theileri]
MKESQKVLKGAAYTEAGPISDVSHHKAAASKAFLENHYRGMLRDARSGGSARPVGPRQREPRVDDFILIKRIGKGAFGEVYVCRRKGEVDGQLYALKRMRKTDMIRKKQILHVRSEKDVMAEAAAKNMWVVRLYLSFQDEQYLYMVMEYMPGGDMISWLCLKQKFDVESTRFYIAELCAAVASVHDMFFVHRDIKPDNILLDARGHIKLTDFGLSKRFAAAGEE